VWDLVDLVVSAPLDGLVLGGFQRTEIAQTIRDAIADPSLSEAEFESLVRTSVKEMADFGWLTDSNFLHLTGGIENIREGGQGVVSTLEKAGTVVDFGFGAAGALKGIKSTVSLVGAMKGSAAAGDVLRGAVRAPGTTAAEAANIPREGVPSMLRPLEAGGTESQYIAPHAQVSQEILQDNRILDMFVEERRAKLLSSEEIEKSAPALVKQAQERIAADTHSRIIDIPTPRPDDFDNLTGTVRLGKADGEAFKSKAAADRFAEAQGGKVREVGAPGGQPRYGVDFEVNLTADGLIDPLSTTEIGDSLVRAFGSTYQALPSRLRELANRSEAIESRFVQRVIKEFTPKLRAVKDPKDVERVESVFREMQSGRLAGRRQALSLAEFRAEWGNIRNGATPSKAVEDLYLSIQEINDATYILKADPIFKDMVGRGVEVVALKFARKDGTVDNISVPSRRITNLDELDQNAVVYNPISGERVAVKDLKGKKNVFKVEGLYELEDGVHARYITVEAPTVRRLYHSDVLGYNAGGPRLYRDSNYMVKQGRRIKVLGEAGERNGNPHTLMTTFSRQEAESAVTELNSLFNGLAALVGFKGMKTAANAIDAIAGLRALPNAEELVRLNTRWNTSVEDIDDLVKFLREKKVDPRQEFGVAAKDDLLALPDETGELSFGLGRSATYDDDLSMRFNSPRNSRRRDVPLLGLDGKLASTVSPLDTIQNDFLRVTHSALFDTFNRKSVRAWLNGADPHIKNKVDIQGTRPIDQFLKADLGEAGKMSPDALRFSTARDHLKRIMGQRSEVEKKWEATMNRFAEYVYDKGFDKAGKKIFNAKAAKSPVEFLRGMAFHARLGLFDPAQLIVQASQTFNILAITGKPVSWLQDMVMHWPLRLSLETEDPRILKEVARRVAPFIGMDADEFLEFRNLVLRSGRLNIGGEVAEQLSENYTMMRGFTHKVANAGRIFFNEGEKVPRSVSMATAWREFRKANPNANMASEDALNWIAGRSDALTAGMTRTSAAAWQKGPISVPLQFLTYSGRMLESLFTNRILTGPERIRLGTSQLAFWGAAGTGFGNLYDYMLAESGMEHDETTYTLLRYGALDALLNSAFGTGVVFGDRIAFAEGFTTLVRDLGDKNIMEVLSGPSGQLVTDVGLSVFEGFTNMVQGRFSLAKTDVTRIIRSSATSPNKLYNAWMMYTVGDYLSRNGDPLVGGLSKTDATLHVLGGQIRDANLAWSYKEAKDNQDEALATHMSRLRAMTRVLQKAADEGRWDDARAVQDEIGFLIGVLPVWQQEEVIRALQGDMDTFAGRMFEEFILNREGGYLSSTQNQEEVK
jgi:hypothetical protein